MTEELQKFVGKWQMYKSENIEDFFKEMGVNYFLRKLITKTSPEQTVTLEGNTVKIISRTTFMTRAENVKLDEEYEIHEEKMGVKFRCRARAEDGKLVIIKDVIEGGNQKSQEITREIIDDEAVVTVKIGDVVCKRWLKRVE